jgi:ABC-2 type transport system ATP-binding protein
MRKYYRGIYPKFHDELFERLYEVFKLPRKSPIGRFSKGMQKQAAFHLSICTRPDLLVLDEPVDGLDPVMRRQIMGLILADVAEHGTTVLVSSHNLRELEDICDHVGILDKGQMLLERSLADMQGGTVKVQFVGDVPDGLQILHRTDTGRLTTLVLRATAQEAEAAFSRAALTFYEVLPLSLEEIFIYELGGADYAVKDIVL